MTKKIINKPPIRVNIHRHFDNLDEPWRNCYYCGQFVATQDTVNIFGGRMYPESELIKYHGQYYCKKHYNWRFNQKFKDDMHIDIKDVDTAA